MLNYFGWNAVDEEEDGGLSLQQKIGEAAKAASFPDLSLDQWEIVDEEEAMESVEETPLTNIGHLAQTALNVCSDGIVTLAKSEAVKKLKKEGQEVLDQLKGEMTERVSELAVAMASMVRAGMESVSGMEPVTVLCDAVSAAIDDGEGTTKDK